MVAKLSAGLGQIAAGTKKGEEIPVIVTLRGGEDPAALENIGFKLSQVISSINVVSGTVPPSKLEELAALDAVELVEADSQAHIL